MPWKLHWSQRHHSESLLVDLGGASQEDIIVSSMKEPTFEEVVVTFSLYSCFEKTLTSTGFTTPRMWHHRARFKYIICCHVMNFISVLDRQTCTRLSLRTFIGRAAAPHRPRLSFFDLGRCSEVQSANHPVDPCWSPQTSGSAAWYARPVANKQATDPGPHHPPC